MTEKQATCSLYETCLLFEGIFKNQPERSTYVKTSYCCDDYKHCARYLVSQKLGEEKVPESLLPQDIFDATKIMAQY